MIAPSKRCPEPGTRVGCQPDGLHDLANRFSLNECQSFVASQVGVGELVLIEAELMENRGMDVAEVVRLVDRLEANGIGRANRLAAANAAAGHPHREAQVVVVAPL